MIGGFLIGGFLCWLVGATLSLIGFVFWLWMLIECLTKESNQGNDKLIWALIIIFVEPLIGALLYFFVRRPQRIRQSGL